LAILHLYKWDVHASLLNGWLGPSTETIEVPVTTLDTLIGIYGRPRLAKIDVEGLEPAVLRGLSNPIETLTLEYRSDPSGVARTLECLKLLRALGHYEVNCVFTESYDFAFPQWHSPEQFAKFLPLSILYGDLVARLVSSSKMIE
jgi:hypothetical protein